MFAVQQFNHAVSSRPIANSDGLLTWIESTLGLSIPTRPICPHHNAPFDYLRRSFFEPATDLVVWAPRGGGKTRLGAVATLLDLLFKPGCQVRILGGSLEQSLKMWEHLHPDILKLIEEGHIKATPRNRRVTLSNGSAAAVLTQSERAVRGLRVQKLRCDEVELFDPKIWSAAQLATRSLSPKSQPPDPESEIPNPKSEISNLKSQIPNPQSIPALQGTSRIRNPLPFASPSRCRAFAAPPATENARPIAASIEALSTLHSPFGLMHSILESARAARTPILRWCILDILEKCPPARDCKSCPLAPDCRGRARNASGFFKIDDAIAMKRRVSQETWDAEMLCIKPSTRNAVFATFDESIHIREKITWNHPSEIRTWLAIDFGFVNPFVCLFIRTDPDKRIHIFDEYVQEQRMLEEHLAEIKRRHPGPVFRVACDPAGKQRNDQTAHSNVQLLKKHYHVRCRSSQIIDGLDRIRRALKPALGQPTLFIHPRCTRLIRALASYRYDGPSEIPLKDGTHDHLIDALRYFFINRETYPIKERLY